MKIAEHLEKLRNEYSDSTAEASRLEKLAALFPDLRRHVGRWSKVVFYSALVNDQATNYETRFNCGCCPDSPLEFWPYLETEHGQVYSDPPSFFIGEKGHYYGTAVANKGWKEELRKARIPEALIERVAQRFIDDRERAHEMLDEAYGEVSEQPEPLL